MAEKISTIIVSQNKRLQDLLKLYFEESKDFNLIAQVNEKSELNSENISTDKLSVFIDMDNSSLNSIEYFSKNYPNCKIIVIKENPDVNFIVSAIRSGAKEILNYPIIKSEFYDILNRITVSLNNTFEKQDKCKMITVFSNKGGIGKTSIAANLALELATITKENVALIDLNFQFGDITTFMDLQPAFDISYMFDNINTINKDFLFSAMEKYKETSLYILADAPFFKPSKQITAKQITKFFDILKESFSYIVIDTDSTFEPKTITTLDYSDLIFLVTIINLPALRNCQRCLGLFDKLGYDNNKVQILVNRYMENDEITLDDVETLLKKKIYWKIPNNYFALMASINKGALLSEINPTSNVAQSYKDLAINVSDSVFQQTLEPKPIKHVRTEKILEF